MQQTFRIGEAYHVEPSLNRVTGPNGITRIEPKVMLVLVCLAERAGQMVPKERLMASVWADTAVGDDVLTRAISELRRLFEDDAKQPHVIETIPKAGYRLIAPVTRSQVDAVPAATLAVETEPVSAAGPRNRRRRVAVLAGSLVIVTSVATWLLRPQHRAETGLARVAPLTVLPGHEQWPTFSPDGEQLAFEWNGENGDNADIYIKMVGSPEVRRLTSAPASDRAPRWSPDGQQIAYIRINPESEEGRIHLVSPLGGTDLKLSDFPVLAPLAWSPDGRHLAAQRAGSSKGIYLIPLDGSAPRSIVTSKAPRSDFAPAFSPDGRRLAYGSCATGRQGCDVYVLEMDAALAPTSPPRRLTRSAVPVIGSLAWTRDGRSVIYNAQAAVLLRYLWRVPVEGNQPPERIEIAGLGATMPATALSKDRLAFARIMTDTDVYRFQAGHSSVPVVASTFLDAETRFSPDGSRIAFGSMRSGGIFAIWLAAADGSGAQPLAHGPRWYSQGSPWWSPDGHRIAFDAVTDDWYTHIWIVDTDGGTPRQLTNDPGDQMVPYWSRDGQWIYFSADRGSGRDIWRVAAKGGPSQPVTQGGSGLFGCESADGKSLLYQPKDADSPLLALPLAGGTSRELVACVKAAAFATGAEGLYYVACDSSPDPALHVIERQSGRDRILGRLEDYESNPQIRPLGLAVSPGGLSVLYLRRMSDTADLMLIENFR